MQDYFDFLIDSALDFGDFEWVEELQKQKKKYKADIKATDNNSNKQDRTIGYKGTIALEDLDTKFANLTDDGVANIDFNSQDDILSSNIIYCEDYYKTGGIVEYQKLDEIEEIFLKGYLIGSSQMFDTLETESVYQKTISNMLSDTSYLSGYIDGYVEGIKIMLERSKGDGDKKKWWQFWK